MRKRRRSRSFGRRRFKRRKISTATKAFRLAKSLQKEIELKTKTVTDATCSIGNTITVFQAPILLCPLASGNTDGTRIGGKVKLHSIAFNYHIKNATAQANCELLRCVLFIHRSNNGADVYASDILEDYTKIASLYSANPVNRGRFQILHDRTYHMKNDSNKLHPINIKKVFKKLNVIQQWSGSSAVVSDLSKNGIWVMFCKNPATTYAVDVHYNARIRYTDA